MHCLQAARNGIYQTKERAENERQSRLLNSLLACGPSISAEHQARDLFSGLKREIDPGSFSDPLFLFPFVSFSVFPKSHGKVKITRY